MEYFFEKTFTVLIIFIIFIFEIISFIIDTMDKITDKFKLLFKDELHKLFIKAGIIDINDIITNDGEKIFLTWLLFSKYKDDFKVEVVDKMQRVNNLTPIQ